MKDVYQIKDKTEEKSVNISYSQPKLGHRVLANFIDIFIFGVLLISIFMGSRAIIQATPYYKGVMNRTRELQLESGLYVNVSDSTFSGQMYDIVDYIDKHVQLAGSDLDGTGSSEIESKNGLSSKAINTFMAFSEEKTSEERYEELVTYYAEAKLNTIVDDVHLYIKDSDGNIVPNPTYADNATKRILYYDNVFKPFIKNKCLPFLITNIPEYRKLAKVDYNFLLFLEIPVSYTLAAILTYFVPPLFFRRGRMTLGKALYHVGLIDSRVLSPTFGRFTARFAIFFFGELVLSLFSFGIPYIISFSMMVFSKNKQGFPDYMLKLYEVDTSKANIYMDYVEAQLKNELHGDPIAFKMKKPL